MGVVAEPGGGSLPLGIAYPRTYRLDPRGSIALFRLVVYKVGVPGLWECVGREFIPAAEGGVGGAYPPPRTGAR